MPGSQATTNSKPILAVIHKGVRFIPRPDCDLGLGVFAMHQEAYSNCQLWVEESPSLLPSEATKILLSITSLNDLRDDQLSGPLLTGWGQGELVKKPIADLLPHQVHKKIKQRWGQCLVAGKKIAKGCLVFYATMLPENADEAGEIPGIIVFLMVTKDIAKGTPFMWDYGNFTYRQQIAAAGTVVKTNKGFTAEATLHLVLGPRRHQFDVYYNLFCLIVIFANNPSKLTNGFKDLLRYLSHIDNIEKLKHIIYELITLHHQQSNDLHSCVFPVLPLRDLFDEQGEIITNKALYEILTLECEGFKAQFLAQRKDIVEMLLNPNPQSLSPGVGFFEKFQCRLLVNGSKLFCINPPPPPSVEQDERSVNRLTGIIQKKDIKDFYGEEPSLRRPQNKLAKCCASLFNTRSAIRNVYQMFSKPGFL